jgi:hypothetical protein
MSEQLPEALQPEDTQSPQATAEKDNKPVYPGSLERYRTIRKAREILEEEGTLDPLTLIAEELAGLAYLLDGIRYSTRKTN